MPELGRPCLVDSLRLTQEVMMAPGLTPVPAIETLADLLTQLGGIAPDRVRFRPAPGIATEADVLAVHAREGRLCEGMDGVLVEKAMGLRESFLAIALSTILWSFVRPHRRLGDVRCEFFVDGTEPGSQSR
jgi:hypothetical protein